MAYGRNEGIDVGDLLWGVDMYPTMFDADVNEILFKAVSEDELLEVLNPLRVTRVRDQTGGL